MVNPTQRNIVYFSYNIFNFFNKKNKKIDLIHFNEVTLVPTIFIFKFFLRTIYLHCRILFKQNNYFGKKYTNFKKIYLKL